MNCPFRLNSILWMSLKYRLSKNVKMRLLLHFSLSFLINRNTSPVNYSNNCTEPVFIVHMFCNHIRMVFSNSAPTRSMFASPLSRPESLISSIVLTGNSASFYKGKPLIQGLFGPTSSIFSPFRVPKSAAIFSLFT